MKTARREFSHPGSASGVSHQEERSVPGPRLVKVGRRLVARPTVATGHRPEVVVAALVEKERDRSPW